MSSSTESIQLNVEGMTCANCALSIERYLHRQGMENIQVSFADDEVRFRLPKDGNLEKVIDGIEHIGYHVVAETGQEPDTGLTRTQKKLIFSAILTLPLLLAMFLPFGILHNPWVQFVLCLPVFLLGLWHFGRSGFNSVRSGIPNMDVLIVLGSSAAFVYSMIGLLSGLGPDYLFFETTSTIITLVLLGQVIEQRSVRQTTSSIRALAALQSGNVRVLPSETGPEAKAVNMPIAEVRKGYQILVEEGEKIPLDGFILDGIGEVDESMLTGESLPVGKQAGDAVTGGSHLLSGLLKIEVNAIGKDTVLSGIIQLVREASQDKPPVQRMADRISTWFVPVVVILALITFFAAYGIWHIPAKQAMLQAIAVLVISCPCAMGLATPTAISVGLGRAASKGVLIKGATTLEGLAKIKRIIFDKTGTLTTGDFTLRKVDVYETQFNEDEVLDVVSALASRSTHPVSRSLTKQLGAGSTTALIGVSESRGMGVEGKTQHGDHWRLGSRRWIDERTFNSLTGDADLFLILNDKPIAGLYLDDTLRPGTAELITYLIQNGIEPVILSGDREQKVEPIARKLGISTWYAGKLPNEKMELVSQLNQERSSAMVGDGINDAPALEKADIGISLVDSTRAAKQAASIILLGGRPDQLMFALSLSRQTVRTVHQNLFWAFFYNVLAIPIAAVGLLNPMIAAGAMAFSDLIVIGNSIRLKVKKLAIKGYPIQTEPGVSISPKVAVGADSEAS